MATRTYKIKEEKCPKCGHKGLTIHEDDDRPTVARCHSCGGTAIVKFTNKG